MHLFPLKAPHTPAFNCVSTLSHAFRALTAVYDWMLRSKMLETPLAKHAIDEKVLLVTLSKHPGLNIFTCRVNIWREG